MENIIVTCLSSFGTAGLVLFIVLKYYNNVRNCINDLMSFCARTCGWFKSTSTKMSIEINSTKFIETLNRIIPELNLPELSIEWVKSDDHGKIRLEPGKAIVLLKYDADNTQNIINTTATYIQKTLLINSKPFLDKGVKKAIDFAVIRNFLSKIPQKNYIVTQYIEHCSEDIEQHEDAFNKIIRVEDEGLLTRILLREYAIWGNKLAGRTPNIDYVSESKSFLDYLFNIASRDFDELTPLSFINKTIKVAVLLVAKYDTYAEKGIEPYVRRIREGFAKGINTFYLLARNDKIEILNSVYCEIISTGNYNLLNGPEIYKDNVGRDNICYCIEVKSDADLAKAFNQIKEKIDNGSTIEVTIVDVHKDALSCDYNGVNVIVQREEITETIELRLKSYYYNGMAIEIVPLKVGEGGYVYGSVLKTNSNPQNLFDCKYEVGATVNAIVQNAEDDFITLLVKDTNQECVAYRRNLTYSRFAYLHKLYPVGSECQFTIKDINYIYNQLVLGISPLPNPWSNLSYKIGDEVLFEVCNIKDTCFETELIDGIFAILPYSELSWFDDEISNLRNTIKRGSQISGRIKRIICEQQLVILTIKDYKSPYETLFDSLSQEKISKVRIENQNTYGLLGYIDSKYRVFIPSSETYIGSNTFKYKISNTYDVKLIGVDKYGTSLVGSFKPFIKSPLQFVQENFHEGQVLSKLKFIRATEYGAYFRLNYKKMQTEVLLCNSEVSNNCFVKDLEHIFVNLYSCPMLLKKIDLERNVILLSIKDLTINNVERLSSMKYGDVYKGKIIGRKINEYYVILYNIWVEIPVESSRKYKIGDTIDIIKASSCSFVDANDISQ